MTTADQLVSEAEWIQTVTDYATLRKWRWTHFRPARTDKGWRTPLQGSRGFPDLIFVRDRRLVFAELKSQRGRKPSPEQQLWLDELERVPGNITVCLWRPSDWPRVEAVLY